MLAILAVSILPAWSQEGGTQEAGLSLRAPTERTLGEYPLHSGHRFREQQSAFGLGDLRYGICYKACVDEAHAPKVAQLEGFIGMPAPTACNWYHSGFLFIMVNGEDVATAPLSSMTVGQRGERAILDMVWHHELASVRARFLGLPGRDNLFCEISLEPQQELESIAVQLRCYPSFFTAAHNRDGARRIQTPGTLVEQGEPTDLPAGDNWWGLYYDEVFDVAKGEGEGPCGLLLLPEEAVQIGFDPGSYAVGTTIEYPPDTERIRLAFWDFKGMTNRDALARMGLVAEAVRDELRALDFTPAAVKGFDVAEIRAQVERALNSEAARADLGDKITEIQEWLDLYAPGLEKTPDRAGIRAEEQLLGSIDRYYSFSWEVKLAELLAGL